MNLRPLIERILDREGGLSDHPADRGGVTNWGITRPFLADLKGACVTDDDVRNLSKDDARRLYLEWATNCRFDALGDVLPSGLALGASQPDKLMDCILDWAVQAGAAQAIRLVQQLVGATVDGVIGPKTLDCAAKQPMALKKLVAQRLMVRANTCVKDPSQVAFLNGWMQRDLSFL
jgi:lysozyme family protein